ncbi:hypothetical protein [Pantanalinema sp. GBBB05]|uniref:hypothetical protein n=1 Tax=Pantanalinema sp. GBBB05 TaxID=2604139 RepID=UPI001DC7ED19|nr:hypothetical protein [Pantanalinema sp. GBBB05]
MTELKRYAADPESVRAYRLRVWSYSEDLLRETDPIIRANTALYLAEAATTLARLEFEAAQILTTISSHSPS